MYQNQNGRQYGQTPHEKNVEKYLPGIIDTWNQKGAQSPLRKPENVPLPAVMIPEKVLEERMTQILNKTREDFLRDAQALQKQKISELELDYELKVTEVQAEYNKKVEENNTALKEKDAELDTAYKIINIQGDILTRFYAEHKDDVIKIVQDAGLSSSDLETLAKVGKPTD